MNPHDEDRIEAGLNEPWMDQFPKCPHGRPILSDLTCEQRRHDDPQPVRLAPRGSLAEMEPEWKDAGRPEMRPR